MVIVEACRLLVLSGKVSSAFSGQIFPLMIESYSQHKYAVTETKI